MPGANNGLGECRHFHAWVSRLAALFVYESELGVGCLVVTARLGMLVRVPFALVRFFFRASTGVWQSTLLKGATFALEKVDAQAEFMDLCCSGSGGVASIWRS